MQEHHVDYNAIVTQRTNDGRIAALKREVEKAAYVCLTDALNHYNYGGAMMMERLEADNTDKAPMGTNRKFKIFVMRDAWGNPGKPGDTVTRKIPKPLRDDSGRKLRSSTKNDMMRRGTWEKIFVTKRDFIIDNKGCIECTYEDAAWLLQEHGVNYADTSAAICGRREMSSQPCKAPGGGMKHIWYWRYWEAPPWVYDTMPDLTEKPKRARKKAADTEMHSPPDTDSGGAEV